MRDTQQRVHHVQEDNVTVELYCAGNQKIQRISCGNLCASQKIKSGNLLKIPDKGACLQHYDTSRFQENY